MVVKGMLIESSEGSECLVSIPEEPGDGLENLRVHRRTERGWESMYRHPRMVIRLKGLAILGIGRFIKHCGIVGESGDDHSSKKDEYSLYSR